MDETELRAFFVAIIALSLFILCPFSYREIKRGKGRVMETKKLRGVPFHHKQCFLKVILNRKERFGVKSNE